MTMKVLWHEPFKIQLSTNHRTKTAVESNVGFCCQDIQQRLRFHVLIEYLVVECGYKPSVLLTNVPFLFELCRNVRVEFLQSCIDKSLRVCQNAISQRMVSLIEALTANYIH